MLFFNANFICYYFYPTKKREEPEILYWVSILPEILTVLFDASPDSLSGILPPAITDPDEEELPDAFVTFSVFPLVVPVSLLPVIFVSVIDPVSVKASASAVMAENPIKLDTTRAVKILYSLFMIGHPHPEDAALGMHLKKETSAFLQGILRPSQGARFLPPSSLPKAAHTQSTGPTGTFLLLIIIL